MSALAVPLLSPVKNAEPKILKPQPVVGYHYGAHRVAAVQHPVLAVAEALTLIVTETLFLLGRKKYHYA